MSNAYEQICVEPSDMWKTALSTILWHLHEAIQCNREIATLLLHSNVSWRWSSETSSEDLYTYILTIYLYLAILLKSMRSHLELVFDKLRKAQLYLEESKLDLYSKKMDCLGHVNRWLRHPCGIQTKMSRICEWCDPKEQAWCANSSFGLVQYLAHFMPDVSAYTGPLAAIQKNGHPVPLGDPCIKYCMDNIKQLAL